MVAWGTTKSALKVFSYVGLVAMPLEEILQLWVAELVAIIVAAATVADTAYLCTPLNLSILGLTY